MDERFKPRKVEKTKQGDPSYYLNNNQELIAPFLGEEDKDISGLIAIILDHSDDEMLDMLRKSNADAAMYSSLIKDVGNTIKEKKISEHAPWLETLNNKMLSLQLFIASTEHEMDLEQGEKDLEEWDKKFTNWVRKFHKNKPGSDDQNPDKK